ncbi:adenylate cyclase regulatory domain-containing protein [Mycobacterium sp.]|uniref:adenylate/guanylate cyclase domain-containing protein n=1 Tax=Mycobacterium sp. TaxID=1785 RepID=UPI003D13E879
MTSEFDEFEESGRCDGVVSREGQEREELVRSLHDRGFRIEQIRKSLSPMMLAANRIIGDDGTTVSARAVADASGYPLELIRRLHLAAGLARADDPAETQHCRADAESILPAAALVTFGFDREEVELVVRLLVDGLTRVAVAMRQAGLHALVRPASTELELAAALERLALQVEPVLDPMINQLARLTLRRSLATEAINAAERANGQLPEAQQVTVAFADMVGFTRLGETVPPQDLISIAGRLAALTRSCIVEPVQLVKIIGDAVMLVSPNAEKLVEVVLDVLHSAARYDLPQLRAGVAFGHAVSRAGDWYGSPVNMASRVTGVAPAGTALITETTRLAIGDGGGFSWSLEETTHLRGIPEEVRLFRATRSWN